MLGVQVLADIVLCLTVIFLVRAVSSEMKRRPPGMDKKTFAEFKELIEASRCSTDELLRALNKVKQVGCALDEKKINIPSPELNRGPQIKKSVSRTLSRGEKYKAVIKMARQGIDHKKIADVLTLTSGEIRLILDLHQEKNENSVSGNNRSKG